MNENKNIRILFARPNKVENKAIRNWLKEGFFLLFRFQNANCWFYFLVFGFVNFSLAVYLSLYLNFLKLPYLIATTANSLTLLCAYRLIYALSLQEQFKGREFLNTYKYLKNQTFLLAILVFFVLELIFNWLNEIYFPEFAAWLAGSETSLKNTNLQLEAEALRAYFFKFFLFFAGYKLLIYFLTWAILPLIAISKQANFSLILKNNFLGLRKNFFPLFYLLLYLVLNFIFFELVLIMVISSISTSLMSAFIVALLIGFFLLSLCCIFCAVKSIFME